MSIIQVRGLTKRFTTTAAVDDLTFDVPAGAVTGFLGPNGAGKSTTLRMLLGLTTPTAGQARILGRAYRDLDTPARWVGAVLEADAFHRGRTGRNHLRVVASAAGLPARRVDEVLRLVGLSEAGRKRVGAYSLGMRQRLALATALLGDPEILILDEPANGLDPQGIRWLRGFLRARAAQGMTVLISSHVLAEVAQMVDHVVIVDRGRLVASGGVDELLGDEGSGARVRSPEADRLRGLLQVEGIASTRLADGGLQVPGVTPTDVGVVAARHGVVLEDLRPASRSLEDVFLALTSRAAAQQVTTTGGHRSATVPAGGTTR